MKLVALVLPFGRSRKSLLSLLLLPSLSTFNLQPSTAHARGTAFTYQGELQNNGSPVSGTYNLTFSLFNTNTSGAAIAGPVTNNGVIVSNGLFMVLIDFGFSAFTGATDWLEIGVETNGVNTFTTLTPRQEITPTPYAITAGTATSPAIPLGMALIPVGSFTMGDTLDGESGASPTNVTVSPFYMDVNPVTYSQWRSLYFWATNHGYGFVHAGAGKAANHPVQTVDWYDAVKWCNARSQQTGKTPVYYTDAELTQVYTNYEVAPYVKWNAHGYRLPTEAEWEKAARGGLVGQWFPWGNVIEASVADYWGNTVSYSYDLGPNGYNPAFTAGAAPYTSPVGYFAPNGYGLYDMAGNVFEWCWDWYGTPYTGGTDPHGVESRSSRVCRGGWFIHAVLSNAA
jgi:formylglycine-generating enzyme